MFEVIYKGEVIARVNTIEEAEIVQKDCDCSYIINEEEENQLFLSMRKMRELEKKEKN